MNKAKIGRTFYYVCLILCILILVVSFLVFNTTKDNLTDEELTKIWIYRYLTSFYVFTILIPLASVVREYSTGEYDKKKMIIKIIIGLGVLLLGTVLIFTIWSLRTAQLCMLASMLSTVYILSPSIKSNEKKI